MARWAARGSWATFVVAFLLCGVPRARADNFAPVARITLESDQVLTGTWVELSAEGSFDPDEGPAPLTFRWDFGDGAISTQASPVHRFVEARAHVVTLTVSDGSAQSVETAVVHALAPTAATRTAASAPLTLSADGARLWVVNPDSGSVSVVEVEAFPPVKIAEVPVGAAPRTVALTADERHALVTSQDDHSLVVVNASSHEVLRRIPVGHQPYGVVVIPDDGRVLVTNQGDATVTLLDPRLANPVTLDVGPDPRAVVATSAGRAYVTHYLTAGSEATVTVLDLQTESVSTRIPLVEDPGPDTASSGRGVPNLLGAAAIDPAARMLWIGGLKSNSSAGILADGVPIAPTNFLRGLLAPIDLRTGEERLVRRIDTNDADSASALAFSPNGRYAYVTHQGAGQLSIYDLSLATLYDPGAGTSVPFSARVDTGDAPQGVVLSRDGLRAYVWNYLSRDVTVVDVSDPKEPAILSRVAVTSEPLPPRIANGKRLFYRSTEPVHSEGNYVACASCHADGGRSDRRVWDFTQGGEGLRVTKDLRGRAGLGDGLLHWSANFDEVQDFEHAIVHLFGGTGLAADGSPPNPPLGEPNAGRSQDLDDLAAYVASLDRTPPSPSRGDNGELTDAARRGRALYEELDCAACHPSPRFTDSQLAGEPLLHDVGTLTEQSGSRLGGVLEGLDTPSLAGLWDGFPYLHDGSAPTLEAVFRGSNNGTRHATARELSPDELADLVAYLRSIDGSGGAVERDSVGAYDFASLPPGRLALPEERRGCSLVGAQRESATALSMLIVTLGLALARRRRRNT